MARRRSGRHYSSQEREWHLDKRVPLALMAAALAQAMGVGWFFSDMSAKVTTLSSSVEETRLELKDKNGKIEQIGEFEVELRGLKESVARIEAALTRALDRLDEREDRRAESLGSAGGSKRSLQ